ncbi:hypothetical protein HDU99_003662, partial [Rhizoclosmatium hyalinum]
MEDSEEEMECGDVPVPVVEFVPEALDRGAVAVQESTERLDDMVLDANENSGGTVSVEPISIFRDEEAMKKWSTPAPITGGKKAWLKATQAAGVGMKRKRDESPGDAGGEKKTKVDEVVEAPKPVVKTKLSLADFMKQKRMSSTTVLDAVAKEETEDGKSAKPLPEIEKQKLVFSNDKPAPKISLLAKPTVATALAETPTAVAPPTATVRDPANPNFRSTTPIDRPISGGSGRFSPPSVQPEYPPRPNLSGDYSTGRFSPPSNTGFPPTGVTASYSSNYPADRFTQRDPPIATRGGSLDDRFNVRSEPLDRFSGPSQQPRDDRFMSDPGDRFTGPPPPATRDDRFIGRDDRYPQPPIRGSSLADFPRDAGSLTAPVDRFLSRGDSTAPTPARSTSLTDVSPVGRVTPPQVGGSGAGGAEDPYRDRFRDVGFAGRSAYSSGSLLSGPGGVGVGGARRFEDSGSVGAGRERYPSGGGAAVPLRDRAVDRVGWEKDGRREWASGGESGGLTPRDREREYGAGVGGAGSGYGGRGVGDRYVGGGVAAVGEVPRATYMGAAVAAPLPPPPVRPKSPVYMPEAGEVESSAPQSRGY